MAKTYHVYIMASRPNGATYIGVTGNLAERIYQHREGLVKGYTQRFNIKRLVYLESFSEIHLAITREKTLKKWRRAWKIDLIEAQNPNWDDLYPKLAL